MLDNVNYKDNHKQQIRILTIDKDNYRWLWQK